jgi:predicted ATPase
MIDSLHIRRFKCFDDTQIPLRNINIFAGTNSSGKSSAIQAILIICNNARANHTSPLNGTWLRTGAFGECRNHSMPEREFAIGIGSGNQRCEALFKMNEDDSGADVTIKWLDVSPQLKEHLNIDNKHVYYLPANRIGPEDSYAKNFDNTNFLGNRAEFVIDFLYKNRKKLVLPDLIVNKKQGETLEDQVNYWLDKLVNAKFVISDPGLGNTLMLGLSHRSGKPVRPYHMGSGVSFLLSVIIVCLSAKKDDLVIIENPEIHLHPKAQSELTGFLCFVANAGVQIIIETHSDHIFNGLRKAILKKQIANEKASVQFFKIEEYGKAENISILLDNQGKLMNFEKGLFDQFDDDLDEMLGI